MVNAHKLTRTTIVWLLEVYSGDLLGEKNIENMQNDLTRMCAKYFQVCAKTNRYNTIDLSHCVHA